MISGSTFSDTEPQLPATVSPQTGDVLEGLLAKLLHAETGGGGVLVAADTSVHEVRTIGFIVITTAVFATAAGDELSGYSVTGLTGVSLPAGTRLPLRLESWSLTSGSVAALLP